MLYAFPPVRRSLLLLCALVTAGAALANEGYQLPAIGTVQRGTGGAGVSSAEDSTWMLINPAGIAGLPRQVDVYNEVLAVERTVKPRGLFPVVNVFAGRDVDADLVMFPAFSLNLPLRDGWTLGTGMLALGGTRVNFDTPRTILSIPTNGDRRGGYEVAQIPVIFAKQFDNGWAIGFGPVGTIQRLRTDTLTLNLRPADGNHRWDYAFGAGLAVGVQKRWERASFGAGYFSRHIMTDFDKYTDIVRYNLDLPQRFQVGVGLHPNARWDFLLDYKWIDYGSVRQLSTTATRSGIGWRDYHGVKGGVRYRPNDDWTLRAGITQGRSPVTNENAFTNAQFPALVRTTVSGGASYQLRENTDLHFAYSWTRPESRKDSGNGDLFSVLGRGTELSLKTHAFSVGLTYRF